MTLYIVISVVSGVLFGVLDGLIHANPVAQRLLEVYKPIARTSINVPAGMVIDIAYGFVMAGVFLLLYESLPGAGGLTKGLSFAVLIWFFRVVMSAASQWMMFVIPGKAVAYLMGTGLGEMVVLGILYGVTLSPGS